MKPDTERKKYHNAKLHQKTKRIHAHLSKDLRSKMKQKKRSLLVRKGDKVRIMRGPGKGKSAKVMRVSHAKMKVYLEGMVHRTARGREVLRALQPSNLELVELTTTKERSDLFKEAGVLKKEEKKPEPKPEKVKIEKPVVEAEIVPEEEEKTAKPETGKESKVQDREQGTVNPKPETGKPVTPGPEEKKDR